jgi:hypothetical protein
MSNASSNPDPVPPSAYPTFQPFTGDPPVLPPAWECYALLHPFSPLQSNSTPADAETPFFELCAAYINYQEGVFFSAQMTGSSGRNWWYFIDADGTFLSSDEGNSWNPVDLGWTLPGTNWFGNESQNASCAGTSPLNWMPLPAMNWWKMPVPGTSPPSPPAATWMWFNADTNFPARLMFGQGPPSPTMGDPDQLALFQMFSFTYFSSFDGNTSPPESWTNPAAGIQNFSFGNPNNFQLFTWNLAFGMTAFMTPVNENFNPLPTRVLYNWKPDEEYQVYSDRAQNTLMEYNYNPSNPYTAQVALLTGPAPSGTTPPQFSDSGFLIYYDGDTVTECDTGSNFPFPQEPPDWIAIPGEEGTIQATVAGNPALCGDYTVTILSVLFPPSVPNYPDSTYLWTWYSPLNSDGSASRPVTFMQSQSGVGVGTSLALADYFYYQEFDEWIDPANNEIPDQCQNSPKSATDPTTAGYGPPRKRRNAKK